MQRRGCGCQVGEGSQRRLRGSQKCGRSSEVAPSSNFHAADPCWMFPQCIAVAPTAPDEAAVTRISSSSPSPRRRHGDAGVQAVCRRLPACPRAFEYACDTRGEGKEESAGATRHHEQQCSVDPRAGAALAVTCRYIHFTQPAARARPGREGAVLQRSRLPAALGSPVDPISRVYATHGWWEHGHAASAVSPAECLPTALQMGR